MHTQITVSTMRRAELDFAIAQAAREGWNPGLHDAECFYQADPQGYLVAKRGDQALGCLSAVSYGTFGFLGLYIVLPGYRGQGIGMQLWRNAMARLDGLCIGLDGVFERQAMYQQSGFQFAWRNLRYRWQSALPAPAIDAIVPLAEIPFEQLQHYDAPLFPAPRSAFLRAWIGQPDALTAAWRENGALHGYAVMRRCVDGWKIGPLFADSPAIADGLFRHLAAQALGQPVLLDVPEPNAAALDLVARHGMVQVFGTARMYCNGMPALPLARIFGITSFELG